ncbi:beta family protein [Shinella sp.]|uniref:beta family protein n=1 Tax=Shinella sp. TaxID=1870904 RepID=UPI003F6ECA13
MYHPNLKTTDSELRALRHLTDDVKSEIWPVFELTRSRKTKALPDGSLVRRASQLNEIYGDGIFVLDLCTEQSLMNDETVSLFDEAGGYSRWRDFITGNFSSSVIPCALYVEDGTKENFIRQVQWIVKEYELVCLRTSVADEFAATLYSWAMEVVSQDAIILCPILYYTPSSEYSAALSACQFYITNVVGNRSPRTLIFAGSSFPRTVTELPGCNDSTGAFPATELRLESELIATYPNLPIEKADFASVHPRRYETKGGTWVPRIDFYDRQHFRYFRFRQTQGGYVTAAQQIDPATLSRLPKCWGTTQIQSARAGMLPGASPSFWISVRINSWISQRAY